MYYIMYTTMFSYVANIHQTRQLRDAKKGVSCSKSAPGWIMPKKSLGQQPRVTKTSREHQSESDLGVYST